LARAIATLADTGGASADLLSLFAALEECGQARATDLFRAAEIRVALGKHQEAARSLEAPDIRDAINRENLLGSVFYGRYLKLRAAVLKDTRQHGAVAEIRQIYDEAIPLAKKHAAEVDAKEWKGLLSGLLQDDLAFRLFLTPAESKVDERLQEIRNVEGEGDGYANALGACAEYEMKLPEATIDWNRALERAKRWLVKREKRGGWEWRCSAA
jgi:hypothetical protein